MNKFIVANISKNSIVLSTVVPEKEIKQAVSQMAEIARDTTFDVDDFCQPHSAGNIGKFSNGTTIQFLLTA